MPPAATWSIPYINDGGPLIALPLELLAFWHGSDGTPASEDFPFGADYARACEAAYPAELISVGPGAGLVIGAQDQVHPVRWLSLPEGPGILLTGWAFGDEGSDEVLVNHLRTARPSWTRSPCAMNLGTGGLVLFHAAETGEDARELIPYGEGDAVIGGGLVVQLPQGDCVMMGGLGR